MIVGRDLILKIENLQLVFIRVQVFLRSANISKKIQGQQILAKVDQIEIMRKYPDKIRLIISLTSLNKWYLLYSNLYKMS